MFTVIIYSVDRLGISAIYGGILSYSFSLPLLLVIGVVGFIGGLKREYTTSLAYIASMVAYDLLTNDMKTVIFAVIASFTLIMGAVSSAIISRFNISE